MKPDWAERLQRTFKRKYQASWLDGYNVGYDRATELQEERRERILAAVKEKRDNYRKLTSYNPKAELDKLLKEIEQL